MNPSYQPSEVESAAQAHWRAADAYRVTEDPSRPKYYACSMLPYPSGKLHMGHVRNYTINDMLARHMRMCGYNVLMPMGWDAFGLPAENAALQNRVPPAQWTLDNIAHMKQQLQAMGLAIDWSREVTTCDPAYYKWNQWLFLKMLDKGIAYRKTQVVNWDPVDKTVLANEQVIDGKGWRTGAAVERREIPGYYLKITDYAEELLDHTRHKLGGWPERVRLMQENWIGKSTGVRFAFTHDIRDASGAVIGDGRMYVFTTRADTIMGVTFCAVAPEHPIATAAAATRPEVAAFIEECKGGGTSEADLATQEKKGVATGLHVTHPLTGEPVEVWVGNYVLMGYGDGAVMGVPAHDERDFAFANKYGIGITQVIWVDHMPRFDYHQWQEWYADKTNGVTINSDTFSGMRFEEAVNAVAHALAQKGLGGKMTTWRLRDWGVSRQRYWGTPIPMIHCAEHGAVPVPERDLPVLLPTDCVPDGSGNPLEKHESFHAASPGSDKRVACPVCGKPARRETDTMDTFVDSAWYFMRYCDPDNEEAMVGEGARYWMPMDQYIGGIEHAILHLLYARFWTKVMRDLDLVSIDEPFTRLLTQGMVLNHIYFERDPQGGKRYHPPGEVTPVLDAQGRITGGKLADGRDVRYGGIGKMGKSERNGVDPQALIDQYGADTARLYTMFTAPPEATLEWNDAAVEGSFRFLRRLWNFGVALAASEAANAIEKIAGSADPMGVSTTFSSDAKDLRLEIHTVLRQVEYDYQRMQYNTVVSGAMKLLNALEAEKDCLVSALDLSGLNEVERARMRGLAEEMFPAVREGFGILLRVLYPATPHITHQLWRELGYHDAWGSLLDAPWPQVDEAALEQDEVVLMLQVNGKLRGEITVPADASQSQIEKLALASEAFTQFAPGAKARRVIVVPGRLVNIVV